MGMTTNWTVLRRVALVAALPLLGAACDRGAKKSGANAAPSSSAAAEAAAEKAAKENAGSKTEGACAKYVAFLDKCLAQVPDERKPPLQQTRDEYKKMLDESKTAELKQMDESCAMGLATTKKDVLCKGIE